MTLEPIFCFQSTVVTVERPDFLASVRPVMEDYLRDSEKQNCDLNEIYPVRMTASMHLDPRIYEFSRYIAVTSGELLGEQGYDMRGLATYFTEMWTQEHHKHSAMDQHVHPGAQIVGFYFVDVPDDGSVATFHDPRPGKVQAGLRETNMAEVTLASNGFHLQPKPGLLVFTNGWLPHSFTRHASDKPIRFIHFNISVTEDTPEPAEVI